MFLTFLDNLRAARVPVTLREFLTFLTAVKAGLVTHDVEGFYHLARATMVKDERHIDRFDRAFARSFEGLEAIGPEEVIAALDLPAVATLGPVDRARLHPAGQDRLDRPLHQGREHRDAFLNGPGVARVLAVLPPRVAGILVSGILVLGILVLGILGRGILADRVRGARVRPGVRPGAAPAPSACQQHGSEPGGHRQSR